MWQAESGQQFASNRFRRSTHAGNQSFASIDTDLDGRISDDEFNAYVVRESGECNVETLGPILDVLVLCASLVGAVSLLRAICAFAITKGYEKEVPVDLRFPLWEVSCVRSVAFLSGAVFDF